MTFSQTHEVVLPSDGLLGSLILYINSAANAGALTNLRLWRLFEYITKIEVMGDGAEVIKSYDGAQALASAFYDQGVEPLGKWGNYSGVTHRQVIPINFGRFLQDELYGLDLSRFNQVTLKITVSATSTQFTTAIYLTLVAYWLREGATSFYGYLREEEWKAWLPVSSGENYSELPARWPIRRIILRANPAVGAANVNQNVNNVNKQMDAIDFTARSGQTRLYTGSFEVLGWLSNLELGRDVVTRGETWRAADGHFDCGVGYVTSIVPAAAQVDDPGGVYPGTIIRADTQLGSQLVWDVDGTSPVEWVARGYAYLYTLPLFVAKEDDLRDALDVETLKQVNLDITPAAATYTGAGKNAENSIVLSRLVR